MSHKLYFRYGTMSSSKSADLLMTAHNYKEQGKNVILIKPSIDTRTSKNNIVSRAGLSKTAHIVIEKGQKISDEIKKITNDKVHCVLVDECQFLEPEQIDDLRMLTTTTPVICYGLRTDYRTKLFPGSARLFEVADTIEEVKTTCVYCNKKSVINAKYISLESMPPITKIIRDGNEQVEIGGNELYQPMCWNCWSKDDHQYFE